MSNKTLYLVRGLPGSGKTTLGKILVGDAGVAIAADDYPGLYIDGKYQIEKQKLSHEWCFGQVENFAKNSVPIIAVCNTFTTTYYLNPYIELGKKYGYHVNILHEEGIIKPDGSFTESVHNVPQVTIDSMRNGWEPMRPPDKRAIQLVDVAAQLAGLELPDMVLLDMDGTLKLTKSGKTFPDKPDDVQINPAVLALGYLQEWCKRTRFYLVSNQRGIQGGQKTLEFLKQEFEYLLSLLAAQKWRLDGAYFATGRNSDRALFWWGDWTYNEDLNNGDFSLNICTVPDRADKPGVGMFLDILKEDETYPKNVWIVGDGHTQTNADDWQFAQACQQVHPRVSYIPVELLSVAIDLASEGFKAK